MDGSQDGWKGRTFAIRIDPAAIYYLQGGYGTRITLQGDFTLDSLYVGPVSGRDPWIAAVLYRLTFNGGNKTINPTVDDAGIFRPTVTDAFPLGLDGSRGLIITGFINPYGNGVVATQSLQYGWATRYAMGDIAAELEKNTAEYVAVVNYDVAIVQFVEGYYTPPLLGTGF
jgi:hypothetical protein